MRFGIVAFTSGIVLAAFGLAMFIPALVDFLYDGRAFSAFISSAIAGIFIGTLCAVAFYNKWQKLSIKEMFLTTSCVWLVVIAFSALPFYLSNQGISYTSAFFEAMSGLTSTGSTNFIHLDEMPKGILLWRAIMQWIGGIGIVMIAIAVLPMLKVGGMQLFLTESSSKIEGKAIPRITQIIEFTILIYIFFTACCFVMLCIAGMNFFDALAHALTCVATGGFSTHDASIAYFNSSFIEWVLIIFMMTGAVPFIAYYFVFSGNLSKFTADIQIRTMVFGILTLAAFLSLWIWLGYSDLPLNSSWETILRKSLFNIVSIVTTTGYTIENYELLGIFAIVLFFFLTFVGGCSGSSSGGIKIFRLNILFLNVARHLKNMIYPHGVFSIRYNGRIISEDIISGITVFITIFFISLVLLSCALSLTGLDFITSLSGAATALANVGPALGNVIGPTGNFHALPDTAKWLLSFGMMLGRLEFTTITVLFLPMAWKNT